jgi:hypothetical protein
VSDQISHPYTTNPHVKTVHINIAQNKPLRVNEKKISAALGMALFQNCQWSPLLMWAHTSQTRIKPAFKQSKRDIYCRSGYANTA